MYTWEEVRLEDSGANLVEVEMEEAEEGKGDQDKNIHTVRIH
jgi:hypothetical protein